MDKLSEEEIMKILKDTIRLFNNDTYCFTHSDDERAGALQGLLDLYNKEKEKNNKWEQIYDEDQEHITNLNNTIFDLEAKNKKLDRENQGLFELYNFNDTSLLAKVLKDYKKEIKKKHI